MWTCVSVDLCECGLVFDLYCAYSVHLLEVTKPTGM